MPAANALANLAVCSGVANAWYIWNSAEPSVSFGSPGARESRNGVVVALAHLAAVEAGQRCHLLVDHHVRQREVLLAVHVVEALGEVARHFDVLDLVAAHRHLVGLEDQDVGSHQHRVHEQAGADACILVHAFLAVLVHRRLVGMRAVEDALAGDGGQEPHQLGGLADVALAVEPHVFRV
ncbi:hypothetical protein G6F23_013522 [Rhizopus arrhizus]|nr:hypothetical protein G6F23_013522 [Rhizopus arrhizus]